jgi:hypothetical protein
MFLGLLIACGFCLTLGSQEAFAQKGGNSGTVTKIDAKLGTITINMQITVKKKKEIVDKEFFLNDDAKVTIAEGKDKKIYTGKEALANGSIKEGAAVTFTPEGDLKIKELVVGSKKGK